MKTQFRIKGNEVAAMLNLASEDETRMNICSLFFQGGTGSVLIVATDGRRIGFLDSAISYEGDQFGVAIPSQALLEFLPFIYFEEAFQDSGGEIGKTQRSLEADVIVSEKEFTLQVATDGNFVMISGDLQCNYPNALKVIPCEGVAATSQITFNADLLNGFRKVAEALGLGGGGVQLSFHGVYEPVEVLLDGESRFYGALMPMNKATQPPKPAWLQARLDIEKKATE